MATIPCFKPTLDNFPKDLFSIEQLSNGVIALHICIAVYLFAIITLILQAFTVGAIKTFADDYRVASGAARNTIVCIGQLLPEFFCSLIGVFVSKGNLGAATVIGSCAANSLLTLGVVGLLITGGSVKLSWFPLWRDNIFYAVAVTVFLWVTFDHYMKWQECLFLVCIYILYALIINFDHQVERGVRRIVLMYRTGDDEQEADEEIEKTPLLSRARFDRGSLGLAEATIPEENSDEVLHEERANREEDTLSLHTDAGLDNEDHDRISLCTEDGYLSPGSVSYASEGGFLSERGYHSEYNYGTVTSDVDGREGYFSEGNGLRNGNRYESNTSRYARQAYLVTRRIKRKQTRGSYYISFNMDHYIDGPQSPFIQPEKWYMKVLWLFSIPAVCMFHITIPDCRKPEWRRFYLLTLLTSTLWIAVLTYVLVWIAVIIGYIWKVPDAVMGFAFLATGFSLSQIVSAYVASQAGCGSKVVYGIYGSNVFNITMNLGFVWLLKCIVHNPYLLDDGSIVYINLCQLIIVLTPLFLQLTRWRLNKVLAIIYLFLYCGFTTIVVLLEYNVIGHFNAPVC